MVTLEDVKAARSRISDQIYLSPCAKSLSLSRLAGCETYLKLENLQMTGAYKERGALNKLLCLSPAERAAGLVAASAGNHAQAVAYHAGRLGIPATIVMPEGTPLIKVANTRGHGARVVLSGSNYDEAYTEARRVEQAEGLTFIHPFDDPFIIAGQGTIALELLEQVPDLEAVLVPVGGGGLISGMAVAFKSTAPAVKVVGVETEALPCMLASLDEGRRVVALLSGGNIDVNVVARVIERGLVRDGRLVRIVVALQDKPGQLAKVSAVIATHRANVIEVHHTRAFSHRFGDTTLQLTLETRGPDHVEDILRALRERGYQVQRV